MTRIPGAIWKPATFDPSFPAGKFGYPGIKTRPLSVIDKLILHDARGFRSYLEQGHRPGESASWLGTILTDGTIWQHFELECPTYTSGTIAANVSGAAFENENTPGNLNAKTTDPQVQAHAYLYDELRKLGCPLKAPVLGQGFEEHRRVSGGATTCPNDRIRWNDIAALLQEDDMPLNDQDKTWISQEIAKQLDGYLSRIKQVSMEGIDIFMRGQVDEKTQRIAHESTVRDLQTAIDNLTLSNGGD